MSKPTIKAHETAPAESPPVAAVEARAADHLLVSAVEAIASARLFTVSEETRLLEVASLLSGAQITMVVVCNAAGVAVGTITETLLVRHLGLGQADIFTTRAGDAMVREFTSCTQQELLSEVLAMMHSQGLVHVIIVGPDKKPVGVLNARDGLRALLAAGNHEEALLRNYVMGIGYQ